MSSGEHAKLSDMHSFFCLKTPKIHAQVALIHTLNYE